MYADRDNRGKASIMEMSGDEEQTMLDALKRYKEYCDAVYQLFSYRDDFKERRDLSDKMIRQMESI